MSRSLKMLFFVMSAIPLLIKLPYLIASWVGSPYERYDAIIWLGLPFVAFACELVRRKAQIFDVHIKNTYIAGTLIVLSLLGYVLLGFKFNVIGVVLAIAIVAISVELLFGHRVFLAQIPTMLFAFLTIPNLSFWFNYYFNLSIGTISAFFFAKILFGICFFLMWSGWTLYMRRCPHASSVIFCSCALATAMFAEIRAREIPNGDSVIVDINKIKAGKWISMDMPENPLDKRLFPHAKSIKRKIFYNDNSNVSLLSIDVGDVADVHPIEICMKSAGVAINNSRQIYLNVGKHSIQVNELAMEVNNVKFMAYSFFINESFSTGYFTKFRLADSVKYWRHYQLITPIEKNERLARERVKDFLLNVIVEENH